MSKIGGSGPTAGSFAPIEANKSDEAAKAAQDDALKNIDKKTTQVVKNKQTDSDQFAVKRDLNVTAGGPEELHVQAKAQAKIDETAMPELQKMVEDTFGSRLNPQQTLKLQQKVKDNPAFATAVEALKDVVEQWQQEALTKLAKEPPKTPETAKGKDAKSDSQGQEKSKLPEPAKTPSLEKPGEKSLDKPLQADAKLDKLNLEKPNQPAKADAAKNAEKTADASKANDAKSSEAAKDTKDAKEAKDAKGSKDPSSAKESKESKEAKDTKETAKEASEAAKDAKEAKAAKPSEEAAKLEAENPLAKPPEGEVGQVDDLGNLIVEHEFYQMAADEMAQDGLTTEFLAQYDMVAQELTTPLFPPDPSTSTRMGSGDTGGLETEPSTQASAQRFTSQGTGDTTRSGTAQRFGSGGGGGGGVGGGGPIGSGGSGHTTVVESSMYAVLGSMEGKDYCEMAYLVLSEMMTDLSKDLRAKQKMVTLRHKMNDAMRNYYAEFMKRVSSLAGKTIEKPSDYEKYRVKETYMEPRLVPGPDGEMEVTMVPAPIEMTFPPTDLEGDGEKKPAVHEDAVTTAGRSVADWDEARGFGEPHSVTMADGKQGYVVTAATFWMTPATVNTRKEVIKTKIQAMKQDMEKEMLGVQKINSLRKQVMENLNKTLRTRADEWQKSIQLLRR